MPPKGRIVINEAYCKGCELCASVCPQGVIELSELRMNARGFHPAELAKEGCTGCGVCAIICPEAAIVVYREVVRARASG